MWALSRHTGPLSTGRVPALSPSLAPRPQVRQCGGLCPATPGRQSLARAELPRTHLSLGPRVQVNGLPLGSATSRPARAHGPRSQTASQAAARSRGQRGWAAAAGLAQGRAFLGTLHWEAQGSRAEGRAPVLNLGFSFLT